MQCAMLIGPFEDNIQMDQSASLKTWVSIAAAILLPAPYKYVLRTLNVPHKNLPVPGFELPPSHEAMHSRIHHREQLP